MEPPENKLKYSLLLLAVGLITGFVLVFWFVPENSFIPENDKAGLGTSSLESKYKYDIEKYKKVDPKLVLYKELEGFKTGFNEATGIYIDENDKIYICGDSGVIIVNQDGRNKKIKSIEGLTAVAVTTDGVIYAAAGDKVFFGKKDLAGSFGIKGKGKGEFEYITSIKIKNDKLYIADAGNRRVTILDLKGKYFGEFVKEPSKEIKGFIIPSPHMDLFPDNDGNLWVANTGKLRFEKYSKDGVLLSSWGKSGINIEEFIGCCNPCNFTITRDGSFITSEKGLPRIKEYDKTGKFIGVVASPSAFSEKCVNMAVAADSKGIVYALDSVEKKVRMFQKQ